MKARIELYKEVLDCLYDGVYFTDLNRTILYWNKGAERITGFSAEEVTGSRCSQNILMHTDLHGASLCQESCPLATCMREATPREEEVYLRHKQGHRLPVKIRISPIRNRSGAVMGGVEVFSDNSEKMTTLTLINALQKEVSLDHLTGLPNRRCLEGIIKSRMAEMERFGCGIGVVFLDIDHFKSVNDRYGHEGGDAALRMIARTMSHISRSFDVIGRWGVEEFVALAVNADALSLPLIAERYRSTIETSELDTPAGDPLRLTVSLGATLARVDDTMESLVGRADELMYQSKMAGRNRVTIG